MEKIEKCANEISRVAHIIENDANNEFNGIIERLRLDEGNKVMNRIKLILSIGCHSSKRNISIATRYFRNKFSWKYI